MLFSFTAEDDLENFIKYLLLQSYISYETNIHRRTEAHYIASNCIIAPVTALG